MAATGASGTSPRSSPTWDLRDDLAIRGLLSICEEHAEVLAQGLILFDGLYATVSSR